MTDKMQKGIITIVIAAVIFAIGCIDRIEIIGRWKLAKVNGEPAGEVVSETYGKMFNADLDKNDVKIVEIYGVFGGYKSKVKLSGEAKKELGDDVVDEFKESNKEKRKYFFDDGKLKYRDKDEDKEDVDYGSKYKLGIFNSLVIGSKDKDEGSLYRRTFPLGYICPSIILKAAAIVVLVKGVKMVTGKDEEGTPIA